MLQVLDTNTEARRLYERLGGEILNWLLVRLYKPDLQVFGNQLVNDASGNVASWLKISSVSVSYIVLLFLLIVPANSTPVTYRQATEDDVPALLRLIKVCSLKAISITSVKSDLL